jgi:hypothetical protein
VAVVVAALVVVVLLVALVVAAQARLLLLLVVRCRARVVPRSWRLVLAFCWWAVASWPAGSSGSN